MSIVLKAEFPKKLSVVFVAAWSEADVSLLSVKRQRFFSVVDVQTRLFSNRGEKTSEYWKFVHESY